jgi:hypothetical protein
MARLSEEEKRELLSVGPSLSADLAKIKKRAGSPFRKPDGTMDFVALTSFLNQANALLGHPRRPFRPILGDKFLL